MGFQYLTNMPLAQAKKEYLAFLRVRGFGAGRETVPTPRAAGRITAEPVYANICAPHYPASAMDGIALAAQLTFGATETTPVTLRPEQFTVVDTGDAIPDGCDAVVMVEDVVRQEDGCVRLYEAAAPWQHIRQIGEDICAGEMILGANLMVSPSAIGAMLAGGVMELSVLRRPVVAIIPTGDEIVPPSASPGAGEIMEFNSSIFSAMLTQWGAVPKVYPIQPDSFEAIAASVRDALSVCDMVLINAGSSAGREDYTGEVIRSLGEMLLHGIAMKPGKPAILGSQGAKPIIGVPGYPVSGILVLEELLKPLIDAWFSMPPRAEARCQAVLSRTIVSGLKYQEFIRVRMGKVGERIVASPLNRGSGVVSSFMKADGILEVPQGVEGYEAGSSVDVRLLRPMDELEHSLVAIGSHDPLLDELANLLHLEHPGLYMKSTHVGSMGGIMALRRGEAHLAGIHLLDVSDGSYNTSFVQRYFPAGGVRLVECVGRTQGLMLQKGNPKRILGIDDLQREGLRYVNRQKGSGTRILADYLFQKFSLDTRKIYGYDREEFTHTSVAAQIASGTADAGMGIYSAARLYDLDFLPICAEQYDLLISDAAWVRPKLQNLISILQSPAFRARAESLGGYTLNAPGAVRERF